ncbi:unnamed protein product [Malus baccata var. baccata]
MVGSGGRKLKAPVFNGENFDFWQIKMKTIFRSHELWDLVENEYETPAKKEEELTEAEKKLMRENMVKDARALGIIQGAVSDQIFPRITTQDNLSNQRIVQKLLISLPKSYDSIAAVIENTKDLDTIDAHDVVDILKGYEQRLDRHGESSIEKAFASFNIAPKPNRFNGQPNSSKYQKNFKQRGKQWSNKADWGNKASFPVKNDTNNTREECKLCDRLHYGECWVKNKVKCHKCSKIGHIARYCNTNKAVQQGRRYIREVMLVPGLTENLLSVEQMIKHGYFLLFGDYKKLRSDKGGYFNSTEFNAFCELIGMERQLIVSYTPQQNGVAERKNRIVVEMAKSMLHEKGLPYKLWGEAVNTAVYLLNRCPTRLSTSSGAKQDQMDEFWSNSSWRMFMSHLA